MFKIARSLFAVVAGYAVMVILTTLVQEVLFGGVTFQAGSAGELVGASVLSWLGAAVGGFVAALLAGRAYREHGLIMATLVVVETIALALSGGLAGPWWFDILAAAGLIAGILLGAEAYYRLRARPLPIED